MGRIATQLRIYTMHPGRLEAWVELYRRRIAELRARHGFELEAWTVAERDQFVWIVRRPGSTAEFEAADQAYYASPEHAPLHEEALAYLARAESWFLEPLEPGRPTLDPGAA